MQCCSCSTNICDKIKDNFGYKEIAITVVLFVVMLVFLAPLIVGQVYKKECNITPWISLWMTVFGAAPLGTFGLLTIIVRRMISIEKTYIVIHLGYHHCYLVQVL